MFKCINIKLLVTQPSIIDCYQLIASFADLPDPSIHDEEVKASIGELTLSILDSNEKSQDKQFRKRKTKENPSNVVKKFKSISSDWPQSPLAAGHPPSYLVPPSYRKFKNKKQKEIGLLRWLQLESVKKAIFNNSE
uniref:Uncharacterized protein n=1 Tax=Heterorhabditis bacteriophora TaxID=37862 RepID=A0A1I7WI11_HETBA